MCSTHIRDAQHEAAGCDATSLEALVQEIARQAAREIYRKGLSNLRSGEQNAPGR